MAHLNLVPSVPRVGAVTPWGTAKRVYEEAPGLWCVDTDTDGGYWLSQARRDQLPGGWRNLLAQERRTVDRAVERVAEEATMRVLFDLGGAQRDGRIRASMDALARAFPHAAFAHNWRLVRDQIEHDEAQPAMAGEEETA